MFRYVVYQIENLTGDTRYMILDHSDKHPEYYLELDEGLVTDCWLSDFLKNENITIILPS